MADHDKRKPRKTLTELTPEQLNTVVGGSFLTPPTQNQPPAQTEDHFLQNTQAAIDAGTLNVDTKSGAQTLMSEVNAQAGSDHTMVAQIEVDLAARLAGDSKAQTAVGVLDSHIIADAQSGSLANQAAGELLGSHGFSASTAATVEHTIATATALAHSSYDQTLAQAAGEVHGSSAASRQFDSDIGDRVTSGAALAGLTADVVAGHLSASDAVGAIAHEANYAGTSAMTAAADLRGAVVTAEASGLASEVAAGTLSATTAASQMETMAESVGRSAADADAALLSAVTTAENAAAPTYHAGESVQQFLGEVHAQQIAAGNAEHAIATLEAAHQQAGPDAVAAAAAPNLAGIATTVEIQGLVRELGSGALSGTEAATRIAADAIATGASAADADAALLSAVAVSGSATVRAAESGIVTVLATQQDSTADLQAVSSDSRFEPAAAQLANLLDGALTTDLAAEVSAGTMPASAAVTAILAAAGGDASVAAHAAVNLMTALSADDAAAVAVVAQEQAGADNPHRFDAAYNAAQQSLLAHETALAAAVGQIAGVDAALVGLAGDAALGPAAVSLLAQRLDDGLATAALSAAVAAGTMSASEAAAAIIGELQATHPGVLAAGASDVQLLDDAGTIVGDMSSNVAAHVYALLANGDRPEAALFAQAVAVDLLVEHDSDPSSAMAAINSTNGALAALQALVSAGTLTSAQEVTLGIAVLATQAAEGTLMTPGMPAPALTQFFVEAGAHLADGTVANALVDALSAGLLTGGAALNLMQYAAYGAGHGASEYANTSDFRNQVMELYGKVHDLGLDSTSELGTAVAAMLVSGNYRSTGAGDGALHDAQQAVAAGILDKVSAAALDEQIAAQAYAVDVASGRMTVGQAEQALWNHVKTEGLESNTVVTYTTDSMTETLAQSMTNGFGQQTSSVFDNTVTVTVDGTKTVNHSPDLDQAVAELDLFKALGALGQDSAQQKVAADYGWAIGVAIGFEVASYGSVALSADTPVYQQVLADVMIASDFSGRLSPVLVSDSHGGHLAAGAQETNDWARAVLTMANPNAADLTNATNWLSWQTASMEHAFTAGYASQTSDAFGLNAPAAGSLGPAAHDGTAPATSTDDMKLSSLAEFAIGTVVNAAFEKLVEKADGGFMGDLSDSGTQAQLLSIVLGAGSTQTFLNSLGDGIGVTAMGSAFATGAMEYAAAVNLFGATLTAGGIAIVNGIIAAKDDLADQARDIGLATTDLYRGDLSAFGDDMKAFGSDVAAGAEAFGDGFVNGWHDAMQQVANDLVASVREAQDNPSAYYDDAMTTLGSWVLKAAEGQAHNG